jgi:branched-chain amino acid transport system permease protein
MRTSALVPLVAAAVLLALPTVLSAYLQDLVVKIAIYAVFALSLELLVGVAGLVSLGHAAFLGIGAYVTVLASGDSGGSVARVLPLAVLAAAAYALFVGSLSLRTKGVYFIMVTLAFAQMAYFVFHDTKLAGGSDGLFLYAKPTLGALSLDDKGTLYYLTIGTLIGTYALLALLMRSRFGHALAGIRVNEQRMRAVGFSTYGYKLAVFVIAGAIAGLAGFLLADADPRWHRQPARRGDRRDRVHAAERVVPARSASRPVGKPLADDARLHDHRVRCAAAQRVDRAARAHGRSGTWLSRCCATGHKAARCCAP